MLIYRSQRHPGNLLSLSLGLQLGGAAGNLLDRVRMGHVTDFVDVGSWPIFNVADASIVVGLALLAWMFLISDSNKSSAKSNGATSDGAAGDGAPGIPINAGGSNSGIRERRDTSQPLAEGESDSEPLGSEIGGTDEETSALEPGNSSVGE